MCVSGSLHPSLHQQKSSKAALTVHWPLQNLGLSTTHHINCLTCAHEAEVWHGVHFTCSISIMHAGVHVPVWRRLCHLWWRRLEGQAPRCVTLTTQVSIWVQGLGFSVQGLGFRVQGGEYHHAVKVSTKRKVVFLPPPTLNGVPLTVSLVMVLSLSRRAAAATREAELS
jgi:hypothetical protein